MAESEKIIVSREDEMSTALRTARLEQIYDRALQKSQIIYEEEKARVLKVQLMLLEDDKFDIEDHFADIEERHEKLEDSYDQTREQLAETESQLAAMQNALNAKLREVETYKAEVQALHSVSADSTKLLTEKLALSREIAVLKPELEHLRSQASSNQNALSEKLALQRELSSLQVDYEEQKRALARMKARDTKTSEEDSKMEAQMDELRKELSKEKKERLNVERELREQTEAKSSKAVSDGKVQGQLEEVKKELAKERKERQNAEREARKKIADLESANALSESKLDAFRTKLKSTKERLKETEADLEKSQKAAKAAPIVAPAANPRKRTVARFDPDMTIGTPGESHAAKRARMSTAVGEKSTFSMTPFLNKTTSILVDTPGSSKKVQEQEIVEQDSPAPSKAPVAPLSSPLVPKQVPARKVAASKTGEKAKTKPLKESTNPRANASIAPSRSKAVTKISLAKVTEEGSDAEENEGSVTADSTKTSLQSQPTKKKRVLGGKSKSTLFDDEEVEAPKPRARMALGAPKGLGLRGGALSLSTKPKSLAEFSPLKKDRRPVMMS